MSRPKSSSKFVAKSASKSASKSKYVSKYVPKFVSKSASKFPSRISSAKSPSKIIKVHVLTVDGENEILNGFCGLGRNVVLRLCKCMWFYSKKVRAIFGMCGELYEWRKHSFFLSVRPQNIPVCFVPCHSTEKCEVALTRFGTRFCFHGNPDFLNSVFVDKKITCGVYRWTVRIEYSSPSKFSTLHLGVTPFPVAEVFPIFGETQGTCSFWFDKQRACGLNGVHGPPCLPQAYEAVPNFSIVSAELDMDAGTLLFFVDGSKAPFGVWHLRPPLFFGMSGYSDGRAFTSLLFRRYPSAQPSQPLLPSPSSSSSSSSAAAAAAAAGSAGNVRDGCTFYECDTEHVGYHTYRDDAEKEG